MSTKIRKYAIIMSLLLLALLIRSHVYGQSPEDQYQNDSASANSIYGRFMKLMSLILTQNKTMSPESHVQYSASVAKNSNEFGRKNPFMPLTAGHTAESGANETPAMKATVKPKPSPNPVIRLTAIYAATGFGRDKPTAIIEEGGVSRTIYVGDTVAGMTIAEIRRGAVILSKGDKKCAMTLGVFSEKTFANK